MSSDSAGTRAEITVTEHSPLAPEHSAETTASPTDTAVILPSSSTAAIPLSELLHDTSVSLAFQGLTTADREAVIPSFRVSEADDISTSTTSVPAILKSAVPLTHPTAGNNARIIDKILLFIVL